MPLIPEDIIAQVIDRCDIVEIIGEYVPLKKAGRNFKGLSPFNNEKTPSFVVSPDKQIFHCFSSGIGGNVISFVMRVERMTFPEAVRLLARKVGVEIPETPVASQARDDRQQLYGINEAAAEYFHKILLSDKSAEAEKARDYLKARGVDLETARTFQLGLALDRWDGLMTHLQAQKISLKLMEKAGLIIARDNKEGYYDRFRNRIIFPIHDNRGQCRAFGARALGEESAKYINSPETPIYTKGRHLYGFHLAKQRIAEEDLCIIVEGYMDCLMPFQHGVHNIVASLGTALTVDQVRSLRRYTKNIVLLYDTDKAGQAAMLRSLDMLVAEEMHVRIARLEEGEDPDSYIRRHGKDAFLARIQAAESVFDYKLKNVLSKFDSSRVEDKGRIAEEMISTIRQFPSAVVQSGYLKELARILGVSENALGTELKKAEEAPQPFSEEKAERVNILKPLPRVERSLVKLLLEEESLIEETRKNLRLEDIQDAAIRELMNKIFEFFEQGKKVDSIQLMNAFEDEAIHELIAQISADQESLLGDRTKIHRDCLNRLQQYRLKDYRKRLLEEMKAAEAAGDQDKLEALKEEFNLTIKK